MEARYNRPMATQDEYIKTALRLPRDLHRNVQDSAERNGRSMNAELVDRLASSFLDLSAEYKVAIDAQQQALTAYKRMDEINHRLLAELGRMILALAERMPNSNDNIVDAMTEAYARLGSGFSSNDRQTINQALTDIGRLQTIYKERQDMMSKGSSEAKSRGKEKE